MKKFWAVMAVLLTFTLPMEAAHAKRFGGGKSFGRTYQTTPHSAPAQSSRADATSATRQQQAPLAQPSSRKGMLGGLFGGLLAGGLLAALFAGGAFDGIQFMDVLLIAAVFFAVMFILRQLRGGMAQGRARPAYAGASATAAGMQQRDSLPASGTGGAVFGQRGAQATLAAASPVPMNLPHGFDSPAFLEGAKNHYRILQSAWNDNDLVKIREYCTPELYDQLRLERASLPAEQHTEVLTLGSELVRADQAFGQAEVSIRFSGRYRDAVEGVEEDFVDVWHLERDYGKTDAPWLITGVESR